MGDSFIRAIERTEKPRKARRNGFAPGVVYGEGIEGAISVKFEMKKLKRLLKNGTGGSRILVKMGDEHKECIIKDIQKDPITAEIIHIDLQVISEDNEVKVKVPVAFEGRNKLEEKKLQIHVYIPLLELVGKPGKLPKIIRFDVSSKKAGDKITIRDIKLDQEIKINSDKNEVIAAITTAKALEIAS